MTTRLVRTVFTGGSYFEDPRWHDGSMVIVSMKDQRPLLLSDGSLSTLADLAPYSTGYANDCVVDQAGRVYVGDFGFDLGDVPHAGRP